MSEHNIGELVAGITYVSGRKEIIPGVIIGVRKDSEGRNKRYDIDWANGNTDTTTGYTETDVDGFKEVLAKYDT